MSSVRVVLKCRLCFDISEPEPGVPRQRDEGSAGASEQTGRCATAECCSCRLQL